MPLYLNHKKCLTLNKSEKDGLPARLLNHSVSTVAQLIIGKNRGRQGITTETAMTYKADNAVLLKDKLGRMLDD